MLTPEQKKLIEEQAQKKTRLSWRDSHSSLLGDLVANIKNRIAEGAPQFPTFQQDAEAKQRQTHIEKTTQRDEKFSALLDHETELKKTLSQIYGEQGSEGVVSFAHAHKQEPADCAAILEAEGEDIQIEKDKGLEIGD